MVGAGGFCLTFELLARTFCDDHLLIFFANTNVRGNRLIFTNLNGKLCVNSNIWKDYLRKQKVFLSIEIWSLSKQNFEVIHQEKLPLSPIEKSKIWWRFFSIMVLKKCFTSWRVRWLFSKWTNQRIQKGNEKLNRPVIEIYLDDYLIVRTYLNWIVTGGQKRFLLSTCIGIYETNRINKYANMYVCVCIK